MRDTTAGRKRRFAIMTVLAVAPVAILGARGVPLLETPHRTITYDVMETAAIDQSSTTVGISDGDLYGKSQADINTTLDELQATGVNTVRVLIPWAGVEPLPGVYDWSNVDAIVNAAAARNIAVLGVLNSTPYYATQPGTLPIAGAPADPAQYADFAKLAATRYVGKVSAYEIWNEPNSAQYFQTAGDAAAAYTALLKAGYTAIKAADPNATVVGGVVGSVISFGNLTINPVDFINSIYADGAKGYFDALSFHPYQFNTPFSQQAGYPNTALEQLIAIRNLMITNGDANLRIWATEYGLPSAVGGEAQQAQFVSDFLNTWSKLAYAGPSFIYTAQDRPAGAADPEGTFGIFRIDWSAKPVQQIIKDFIAAHTPTTPTNPPNPPNPTDPGAAFGAAVAAYFQAVLKAFLTALAQAFANIGVPQTAAATQLVAVKAAIAPAAAVAITDVAAAQVSDTATLDQVKEQVAAAADQATATTEPVVEKTTEVTTAATPDVTAAAAEAVVAATAVTPTPAATDVAASTPATPATPAAVKDETDTGTAAPAASTSATSAASSTGTPSTSSDSGSGTTGASEPAKSTDTGKSADGKGESATGSKDATGSKGSTGTKGSKDATSAKDPKDAKNSKDAKKATDRKTGPGRRARGDDDAAAAASKSVSAPAAVKSAPVSERSELAHSAAS